MRIIVNLNFLFILVILLIILGSCARGKLSNYYGTLIGPLQYYAHGIRGTVYAIDETTIFIKGFYYDGTGPDAYFWVGKTPRPSPEGDIIPYPEDYVGR